MELRLAPLDEVDPRTLYEILRLRVDVFVVEQECVYPELDGRDAEPGAMLLWGDDDAGICATLRLLTEADGTRRIGRVATAVRARGAGVAASLVRRALLECGDHDVVLDAQAHLAGWYARSGFEPAGPEFLEDGIPHIPMRRRGSPVQTL